MRSVVAGVMVMSLFAAIPAAAQNDVDDCKDHPLFTRFPNMHIYGCDASAFDARRFPVGAEKDGDGKIVKSVEIQGPVFRIDYKVKEGVNPPPSGLQLMRNFENAAKKDGGTILGSYPGWCKAYYEVDGMPGMGNGCMSNALTMKFVKGNKETWVFFQASDDGYVMTISEKEAMKQDVAVNELADKLTKDGFITLYINFDTGKSTIKPDSAQTLDTAAAALKAAATLKVEIGGHTDNVGTPEANLKLSQERAQAVMAALVQRGVKAGRLTARGYGQTSPVADNRTEEGRGKNRRVELSKK